MKTAATSLAFAAMTAVRAANFSDDLAFLQEHTDVVLLTAGDARVAVAPAWQGRVMTSTARGGAGTSFGWVNRALIASKKLQPHINVFGGEDRVWLGPEGGQFSIFFAPGVKFDLAHWFTPAALDTEPFEIVSRAADRVVCRRAFALANYSGTKFSLELTREVHLLRAADALAAKNLRLPDGVSAVAFESVNTLKNAGAVAWRKDTGLLSLWILGMFNASAARRSSCRSCPGPSRSSARSSTTPTSEKSPPTASWRATG